MGIGAAIAGAGAIASVGSSLLSSNAASSAADTQAAAANNAAQLTHQQYLQTAANLKPFLDTGSAAFQRLGQIYGLGSGTTASAPPAPAASGGTPTFGGAPASGGSYQVVPNMMWIPLGGSDGGSIQQQNGYNVVDAQGNLINSFDNTVPLEQIQAMYPATPAAPAAPPAAAPPPATSADALSAYGLPGLTYNPANYGLGNGVFDPSQFGLGNGTFQPTQAQLEATPGYQFTRDQGLKSVQSAAAAKGQGISGAALKGAAQFATGLADNTLTTQANIFNQNLTNARSTFGGNLSATQGIFQQNLGNVINPLLSYAQLGENAGAQTGSIGAQAVNAQSNLLTGAANAQAAGIVGSANALSSGANSLSQAPLNYLLYNNLLGSGGGGGGNAGGFTGVGVGGANSY